MSARRIIAVGLASGLAVAGTLHAGEAREKLAEGMTGYATGDYEGAASAFGEAAELARTTPLDPAVALFDQANALLANGQPAEALAAYEEALRTGNLDLQSRVYFNQGNAHMALAEPQAQQGQTEPALQSVSAALESYERSVTLNQEDVDAKANYELAWLKKKELEMMLQQQQQQQPSEGSPDPEAEQQEGEDRQEPQPQQDQPQQNPEAGQEDEQEDEQGQEQPQQQAGQDEPSAQQQPQQQQPASAEMTPDEARMLLEAMKEEEAAKREQMRLILGSPVPVERDW